MSQNAHTLLLFFSNAEPYKKCLKILRHLEAGNVKQADEISEGLGVNIAGPWSDDWFNQKITPTPKFLRLDYETSTGYDMPLELLQELFDVGLRAACLEVFYDQVGESGQFYFMNSEMVDKASICQRYRLLTSIIDEQFENKSEELDNSSHNTPTPIKQLIDERAQHQAEASEMVDALVDLAKVSRETGVNPVDALKSAMVVRAVVKGLLQGVGFGVVTVLLFKGVWLWIGLSVVLSIVLPLFYVSKVNQEFDDEDGQNEENHGSESDKNEDQAAEEDKCDEGKGDEDIEADSEKSDVADDGDKPAC